MWGGCVRAASCRHRSLHRYMRPIRRSIQPLFRSFSFHSQQPDYTVDTSALENYSGDHERDHATITANASRNREDPVPARIVKLEDITPTVRLIQLRAEDLQDCSFKCGQWVDLFIPEVDIIGGFSILSKPSELPYITLAVKHAYHPPAYWVHNHASVGQQVALRIGGEFCYNIYEDEHRRRRHLLLVTGGIGFTPLHSILAQWYEWLTITSEGRESSSALTLVYSAKTQEELLFAGELKAMQQKVGSDRLRVHFTETASTSGGSTAEENTESLFNANVMHQGRIDRSLLEASVSPPFLQCDTLAFLCGPPVMTDTINDTLLSSAMLPSEKICFEKWW
eukprot:gb/GECG01012045.1/.p1 GENE.gb/GECG01012045.1/~~gb/GECG01012045.1/.p1  ORF type:complete len:338 (+),score=22.55 gb/GECG01012045.1/:1-1014(+)